MSRRQAQHHGSISSTTTAKSRALADALAGVSAALVSLWVFYPMDVWKTHVQAGRPTPPLRRMMSSGLSLKTVHTASSSFFYFYLYSWILSLWTLHHNNVNNSSINSSINSSNSSYNNKPSGRRLTASCRLLLAAVAAMANTCLTLPLDVLSARHQTMEEDDSKDDDDSNYNNQATTESADAAFADANEQEEEEADLGHNPKENSDDSLLDVNDRPCTFARSASPNTNSNNKKKKFGSNGRTTVAALWKGLGPSLLLCANPAINYTVFDSLKARYITMPQGSATGNRNNHNLTMAEAFLLGLFSKFVATMATYPLIRAKVMLMVTNQASMTDCLRDAYRSKGLTGLYEGCTLQLLHTMLKSALLMTVRERIAATTRRWIAGEGP